MKLAIKYYPQYDSFSCGPVALKMLFDHFGIFLSRENLTKRCWAKPTGGSGNDDLIRVILEEGLVYKEYENSNLEQLKKTIENGYTPLVNYYNPLSKCGHYSLITGYSRDKEFFYFNDPVNWQDYCLSFASFEELWHNNENSIKKWFLVVGRERIRLQD
jgi:ABC-type bacteriocin/lantibiotic exporter with double-glycine peptidase domain